MTPTKEWCSCHSGYSGAATLSDPTCPVHGAVPQAEARHPSLKKAIDEGRITGEQPDPTKRTLRPESRADPCPNCKRLEAEVKRLWDKLGDTQVERDNFASDLRADRKAEAERDRLRAALEPPDTGWYCPRCASEWATAEEARDSTPCDVSHDPAVGNVAPIDPLADALAQALKEHGLVNTTFQRFGELLAPVARAALTPTKED